VAETEKLHQKHAKADQMSKLNNARLMKRIDNVKEVALSCERKIKEFKVHKINK
jgi:hypothetical protein